MTLAGWIMYNVVACGIVILVGYLTGRSAIRRNKAISDAIMRRTEEQIARTQEEARADRAERARHRAEYDAFIAELDAREDEDDIELAVQLRKHPETDAGKLPALAAMLIRSIDQLDRDLGGDGVEFDETATTEDADHLTLRFTFRDPDGAEERRDQIRHTLATLAADARQVLHVSQDADLRARIAAELDSPIPRELAPYLDPIPA